jgi:hypothetical protein
MIEFLMKSSKFAVWLVAGILVVPCTLIAYLFFEKWQEWFENL